MTVQSLEDLITCLLDSVPKANDDVRNEVAEALSSLGQSQPRTMLRAAHTYLLQHSKLDPAIRAFIIRSMNDVVANDKLLESLDEQNVLLIINLATQEMTMTKDSDDWADAAHDLLVTLGKSRKHVTHVMDALLQKFPPGLVVSPHRYVVVTLGSVAEHNAEGFVPFLTDVLSRTVPLLQHIRSDSVRVRCAWARSICNFCEAVRECESAVHEMQEDSDPTSDGHNVASRVTYCDQMETVYDSVFAWTASKDPKVRAETAECIGELCLMIRPQKIIDDLKRLVNTLLSLYKKSYSSGENQLITLGVCRFLEATCMDDLCPLDAYLDDLLAALFPNTCLDADDASSTPTQTQIKNHSEAFRCFHVAAARFADKIVYFLLHKMQHNQDMQRLGAINVMRHLLNSAGAYMEDKRSLVMMGLRKLLAAEQVSSIRVKRAVVQLCVALSDHAYVDAEGGQHVIAFLVRNLVNHPDDQIAKRAATEDVAGLNQLRTQCAQALHTIASTCVCAGKLLWPYLLEFICAREYTPVVADICKCVRTLLQREREAGRKPDYTTGFDNERVAGKMQVMSRLIVCMCGAPLNGLLARRARDSLGLMVEMAEWFHPSTVQILETEFEEVDLLISELSSQYNADSQNVGDVRWKRVSRWHDAVLSLVCDCVSAVSDGDWRQELAAAMGKQLDLYKEMPHEKAFALRCMGAVLSKIAHQPFVIDHLLLIFRSTNHSVAAERAGCARGIGACAQVHTDLVLIQLENVSKWEHARKSQGLFGFIKGSLTYTDQEMVNLRSTLMLAYGHVVLACPLDTVTQRLEQTVIVFLRNYMANQRQETVVRESLLETMRLICEAVHPSRLGTEYIFDARNELLAYVKDYVQSENAETLSSSIRLLAAKAAASLVRLPPCLSDTDVWELGHVLTKFTLPICREKSGLKTVVWRVVCDAYAGFCIDLSQRRIALLHRSALPVIDDDESASIMEATVAYLGAALQSIVERSPNVGTVTLLLKMLQPYYGKLAEHERARAIDLTVLVLKVYLESADDIQLGHASEFSPLSSLLARLSPRLVDSLLAVRLQALSALHVTLTLAHVHKGHPRDSVPQLFSVADFSRDHLSEEGRLDGQTAKKAIKKFSQVIEHCLPQSQVQTYLSALFDMLSDRQSQVSSSAAQLLSYALTNRGDQLHSEGETIVSTLLKKLPEVHGCVQTYTDVLSALCAFAAHQQYAVADVMLLQSLPYSVQVSDAWECVCREKVLFPSLLDHLLELLTNSLTEPFEILDTGGGSSIKVCKQEPCECVAALTEMIKGGEPESAICERVPAILAALLQFLSFVSDTQFPVMQKENKDGTKVPLLITAELRRAMEKPGGLAAAAIRTLLQRMRMTETVEEMNSQRAWTECLDSVLFVDAISVLTSSIVEHSPQWAEPLADTLMEKASSEHEPLRLTAVAVVASLIKKSPNKKGDFDERLLIDSVTVLQKALDDESLRIRKLCVRGLGELGECVSAEGAARFTSLAVEAAMHGLDDVGDRRDEVAMEAIHSLNKLVSRASDQQLRSILPQVLLKIRPCFEKDSPTLRSAAFLLFGELGNRVGEGSTEYTSHLHTNLVSVLLHLGDEEVVVQKACGVCLRRVSVLLDVDAASQLVERSVSENGTCTSYYTFQKDMAMVMALSFPDRVNTYALTCCNYLKSTSALLRGHAAHLTGHLLGCLTPQLRATISKELIFTGLVALLQDDDILVRIAATKAIANLHQFT